MSGRARAEPFDVVVVGSLNLDLVVRTERHAAPGETVSGDEYHEYPGGKGLNQAVAAARAGARVALVGSVGDDPAGDLLCDIVRSEGISDRWVTRVGDVATGRALITVSDSAENSIVVVAGANAATTWPTDAPDAPVVLAQLEVPIAAVTVAFETTRRRGGTTILNPSPAVSLEPAVLSSCSIVVPNEHEVELLGGTGELLRRGVPTVITTLGGEGVRVDGRRRTVMLPSFEVVPVDTTGAGDAFCGNLAAGLSAGDPLELAVNRASAAGALATTAAGAVPSLPRRADVDRLVDRSGHRPDD